MSQLYVGNLPTEVTENEIRQLFFDNCISCYEILLKQGGYAFVDCTEQSLADKAIDKLNGITFLGMPIIVEPSVDSSQKKRSSKTSETEEMDTETLTNGFCGSHTKVMLSNVANHVEVSDVEHLLSQCQCHASLCEKVPSRDSQSQNILLTFESNEQAQQAVNELNNLEFEGQYLKAELRSGGGGGGGMGGSGDDKRGPRGGGRIRGPTGFPLGGGAGAGGGARQTDFPLRILVQSDMVGAIIGRQGSTIRQITQQSRARVDVHRKDNVGSLEKAITIYGNPENCTNACKRILEVMKQEATTNNKGEITLKVLAHNNLIGRIIGKAGNTIKRIMQETDTKITVSSINDINSFNLERIITVKGSIDNMSKAESMISSKLRQSYENDLQAMAVQGYNYLITTAEVPQDKIQENEFCIKHLEV